VRVVGPSRMYGRLTATARHLTDPAHKLYVCDMEGLIYEVDVHTLEAKLLFKRPVPGWHGKGGYTGQGRLVLAYNGESPAGSVDRFKPFDAFLDPTPRGAEDAGSLCEWDGKTWRLVERRQFTEVTGPGGIWGAPDDAAPLWSIGWDRRSLILKLLDAGQWHTFRLPIACSSFMGRHGWHTEWPRIREVGAGKCLMNMHGGWFDFPIGFALGKTGGLRPLGVYLKMTADFCEWNGRIVFGCDDAAKAGFLNTGVGDPQNRLVGQSNSNLWFTTWEGLTQAGRPAGFGGPWLADDVKANAPSVPFLFAGYEQRVLHLAHHSKQAVGFTIDIDQSGNGRWTPCQRISIGPEGYAFHVFPQSQTGQWVRLTPDRDAERVTAFFRYGPGGGARVDRAMFSALADVDQAGPWTSAVVRSEGDDRILLAVLARTVDASGKPGPARTCQVDEALVFRSTDPESNSAKFLREHAVVGDRVVQADQASVIVTEGKLRVRLPKSHAAYDAPWATGWPRALREVVTERSLLNAAGTFYLLPRENSGGLRAIRPICTHNKRITDFCSWRGLLVLAGCVGRAQADGHYFAAKEGDIGLWFGDVDDLWKLGKPVGRGGPWLKTQVQPGELSDPFLMAGYDRKQLVLCHDGHEEIAFTILVDVAADNTWFPYATIRVPPGETVAHVFPWGYSAHWVRLKADRACRASAVFVYD